MWLDPIRVRDMLPALTAALVNEAGLDEAEVTACADSYAEALTAADAEITEKVDALAEGQRVLVTNHDALGYFADRYDFEVVGTVIPGGSSLSETNAAQLESLAQLIEAEGVPAIFGDVQLATDDADALASRVGDVTVVSLFTGSLGDGGADTYVDLLTTNATRIVDGLSG